MNCEECGAQLDRHGWRYCPKCRRIINDERAERFYRLPWYLKTDESSMQKRGRVMRGEQHKNPGKAAMHRADKR